MKNRLTDIFDIFDIFGTSNVAPPEPLHPADELVLRGVANMVISFICTNQIQLKYGGNTYTYFAGTYSNVILDNEANEDVILRGEVVDILSYTALEYACVSEYLINLQYNTYLRTIDCRNAGSDFVAIINNTPGQNNTDTVYAVANTPYQAETIVNQINNSSVSDGILYIDRTQPYADTITDAATAKGWRIYDL